jgi:hypothetical protein
MATLPTLAEQSRSSLLTVEGALRRVFSFPALLGVLLFSGSFSLAKDMVFDPDMWWHMAVGQRILATHAVPWTETYSSTVAGAPWIAYEWLGEIAIGAVASVAGLRSAAALLVVLSGILVLLLYRYAAVKCGDSKAAFAACAVLVPVLGAFFTLRPQLFGAIFLVLTLLILERFRQGRSRALWLLPPLFLVWVNTHGSFVFGFLVLGIAWLSGQFQFSSGGIFSERWSERQSIELLLAILASALVLPITPYGTRLAAYPLTLAFSQPVNVASIQEWSPLGTGNFVAKYLIALLIALFGALLAERPRFRLHDVLLAMFGAIAACLHVRFLLVFVIFLAPLFADLFARWIPRYRADIDRPAFNAILIAIIAMGIVFLFPSRRGLDEQSESEYPRSAVQYLAEHPVHGTLFNDYGWGGYLIWAAPRPSRVFIDGRADVYEYGGVLADYLSIIRLEPNAVQLLKKYDVQACLIPRNAPLGTALSAANRWERVYEDRLAAVYVKKPGAVRR